MSSIGPFSPTGIGRPSLTRALSENRQSLDDLLLQLSSGKVSQTYAGIDGRTTSLAMRAKLADVSSFQATASTLNPRINLMTKALERLDAIGAEYKTLDPNEYLLTTSSRTIAQTQAEADLRDAIAQLNTDVAGRYLFSGRSTDTKPVLSVEAIFANDGAKAGLKTVIAERKLADLGADGRGRVDVSAVSGTSFTVSQETSGPFGFKITGLTSTLTDGIASGPTGPNNEITLGVSGTPNSGEEMTIGLTLPDGSKEEIVLKVKASDDASGLNDGEFRVGATPADTAANMQAAFDAALKKKASTSLVAASSVQAGEEFFNVAPGAEPARVAGFDATYATEADRIAALQSATGLDTTGTAAKTVSWYVGENAADDPRKTAAAKIDDGVVVGYGARANEDGTRRIIQNLAVFAAMTLPSDDPDSQARYSALSSRMVSALGATATTDGIKSMAVDLATSSRSIAAAGDRHTQMKNLAQDALSQVEDVSKEEVSLKILAIQTSLQASYQVTASLRSLSLVNFL